MVFTYQHKSPVAWNALGDALARSGLKCTTVLPLRGEGQGGLHSYDGTIKWDAVFVCRKDTPVSFGIIDEVVVPVTAIEQAKRKAAAYAEELKKTPNIAFRDPDRINLERAMIVASVVIAPTPHNLIPLYDALKLRPTGG